MGVVIQGLLRKFPQELGETLVHLMTCNATNQGEEMKGELHNGDGGREKRYIREGGGWVGLLDV